MMKLLGTEASMSLLAHNTHTGQAIIAFECTANGLTTMLAQTDNNHRFYRCVWQPLLRLSIYPLRDVWLSRSI